MRQIVNSTYITLDAVVAAPHSWPPLGRPTDDRAEVFCRAQRGKRKHLMMARSPAAAHSLPTFVQDRPLTLAALAFASRAHDGDTRDADGAPFILHPLEVASLLSSCGCRDAVTAAAILHDTLEDTDATGDQLRAEFGNEVARLVGCLTEDERIDDLCERKSALRSQVEAADDDVAKIYAADKLSKIRELRIRLNAEPGFALHAAGQRKLEHYWRSLAMLERTLAGDPLVRQLRFELEAIRDLPPRNASRPALARASTESA